MSVTFVSCHAGGRYVQGRDLTKQVGSGIGCLALYQILTLGKLGGLVCLDCINPQPYDEWVSRLHKQNEPD